MNMRGAEERRDAGAAGGRVWLPALAVLVWLVAATAEAQSNCVQVRNMLRRGMTLDEVVQFTGISPGAVQTCAASSRAPAVIQPAGPPPHGAAGPAPAGAAGPAPHGAAGPPPHGAAGPAPHGAAGPAPGGFAP